MFKASMEKLCAAAPSLDTVNVTSVLAGMVASLGSKKMSFAVILTALLACNAAPLGVAAVVAAGVPAAGADATGVTPATAGVAPCAAGDAAAGAAAASALTINSPT